MRERQWLSNVPRGIVFYWALLGTAHAIIGPDPAGLNQTFKTQAIAALDLLKTSGGSAASQLIETLQRSPQAYYVVEISECNGPRYSPCYPLHCSACCERVIFWDPKTPCFIEGDQQSFSPLLALAHELRHAFDHDVSGEVCSASNCSVLTVRDPASGLPVTELNAVATQNAVAQILRVDLDADGFPDVRRTYHGTLLPAFFEPGGCAPGRPRVCYEGRPETQAVGVCHAGTQTCTIDGKGFLRCVGQLGPKPEVCADGLDNDCDGLVDGADLDCAGCVQCLPSDAGCCSEQTAVVQVNCLADCGRIVSDPPGIDIDCGAVRLGVACFDAAVTSRIKLSASGPHVFRGGCDFDGNVQFGIDDPNVRGGCFSVCYCCPPTGCP